MIKNDLKNRTAEFKAGDVVELKCGSNPMIIYKINDNNTIVMWQEIKTGQIVEMEVLPVHIMQSNYIPVDNSVKEITGMTIT